MKGLNSILSDCFSLLPIVLFYKPSYPNQLHAWNPGGLTPRSSHFLCEDSKSRHRTMWPVDHKLLSQNNFVMALGKTFTTGMAKATFSNAIHFHVEITLQVVKVHTSLALPHGRRLIHKCSTHLSVGPIQNSTHRCKGSVSLQVLCL